MLAQKIDERKETQNLDLLWLLKDRGWNTSGKSGAVWLPPDKNVLTCMVFIMREMKPFPNKIRATKMEPIPLRFGCARSLCASLFVLLVVVASSLDLSVHAQPSSFVSYRRSAFARRPRGQQHALEQNDKVLPSSRRALGGSELQYTYYEYGESGLAVVLGENVDFVKVDLCWLTACRLNVVVFIHSQGKGRFVGRLPWLLLQRRCIQPWWQNEFGKRKR